MPERVDQTKSVKKKKLSLFFFLSEHNIINAKKLYFCRHVFENVTFNIRHIHKDQSLWLKPVIHLITVIHSSSHAHIKTSAHQRKGQTSLSMEIMRITYMVSHITSVDLQVCQYSEWHVAFILSQTIFYEAQLCITEPEAHRRNFEIGHLLCTWWLISLC